MHVLQESGLTIVGSETGDLLLESSGAGATTYSDPATCGVLLSPEAVEFLNKASKGPIGTGSPFIFCECPSALHSRGSSVAKCLSVDDHPAPSTGDNALHNEITSMFTESSGDGELRHKVLCSIDGAEIPFGLNECTPMPVGLLDACLEFSDNDSGFSHQNSAASTGEPLGCTNASAIPEDGFFLHDHRYSPAIPTAEAENTHAAGGSSLSYVTVEMPGLLSCNSSMPVSNVFCTEVPEGTSTPKFVYTTSDDGDEFFDALATPVSDGKINYPAIADSNGGIVSECVDIVVGKVERCDDEECLAVDSDGMRFATQVTTNMPILGVISSHVDGEDDFHALVVKREDGGQSDVMTDVYQAEVSEEDTDDGQVGAGEIVSDFDKSDKCRASHAENEGDVSTAGFDGERAVHTAVQVGDATDIMCLGGVEYTQAGGMEASEEQATPCVSQVAAQHVDIVNSADQLDITRCRKVEDPAFVDSSVVGVVDGERKMGSRGALTSTNMCGRCPSELFLVELVEHAMEKAIKFAVGGECVLKENVGQQSSVSEHETMFDENIGQELFFVGDERLLEENDKQLHAEEPRDFSEGNYEQEFYVEGNDEQRFYAEGNDAGEDVVHSLFVNVNEMVRNRNGSQELFGKNSQLTEDRHTCVSNVREIFIDDDQDIVGMVNEVGNETFGERADVECFEGESLTQYVERMVMQAFDDNRMSPASGSGSFECHKSLEKLQVKLAEGEEQDVDSDGGKCLYGSDLLESVESRNGGALSYHSLNVDESVIRMVDFDGDDSGEQIVDGGCCVTVCLSGDEETCDVGVGQSVDSNSGFVSCEMNISHELTGYTDQDDFAVSQDTEESILSDNSECDFGQDFVSSIAPELLSVSCDLDGMSDVMANGSKGILPSSIGMTIEQSELDASRENVAFVQDADVVLWQNSVTNEQGLVVAARDMYPNNNNFGIDDIMQSHEDGIISTAEHQDMWSCEKDDLHEHLLSAQNVRGDTAFGQSSYQPGVEDAVEVETFVHEDLYNYSDVHSTITMEMSSDGLSEDPTSEQFIGVSDAVDLPRLCVVSKMTIAEPTQFLWIREEDAVTSVEEEISQPSAMAKGCQAEFTGQEPGVCLEDALSIEHSQSVSDYDFSDIDEVLDAPTDKKRDSDAGETEVIGQCHHMPEPNVNSSATFFAGCDFGLVEGSVMLIDAISSDSMRSGLSESLLSDEGSNVDAIVVVDAQPSASVSGAKSIITGSDVSSGSVGGAGSIIDDSAQLATLDMSQFGASDQSYGSLTCMSEPAVSESPGNQRSTVSSKKKSSKKYISFGVFKKLFK